MKRSCHSDRNQKMYYVVEIAAENINSFRDAFSFDLPFVVVDGYVKKSDRIFFPPLISCCKSVSGFLGNVSFVVIIDIPV